jgi:hypothetical protein
VLEREGGNASSSRLHASLEILVGERGGWGQPGWNRPRGEKSMRGDLEEDDHVCSKHISAYSGITIS